jgi:carboxypeptidase Q
MTVYQEGVARIPFAAITTEDADRLLRLQRAGQKIEAKLLLRSQDLPPSPSRNIVVEVRGRERPEEVVVFGCHIDSWDVGQGAHDDAGNCLAAWHALLAIREHKPRRTVRLVMWVNEENGSAGAKAYAAAHGHEKHVLAIEADSGVFRPTGWLFSGSDAALAKVVHGGRAARAAAGVDGGRAGRWCRPATPGRARRAGGRSTGRR